MEAARFLSVAVAGLALDLIVAWSAAWLLKMPLWIAAACGIALAAVMNYAFHELFTYRNSARRLSASRVLRYVVSLAATLAARVTTVAALAAVIGWGQPILVLLAGSCTSFGVNSSISKFFVFPPSSELKGHRP
jgi:putative flippase GtrA